MAKYKYYVVWKGHKTGIFDSWAECSAAISGYEGARYKGFATKAEAEYALVHPGVLRKTQKASKSNSIHMESLSVDAACSGNPGPMEYRGVHTRTKKVIFHQKHKLGTNNIGEFLAIVHGISYLKKNNIRIPIYTDSQTALSWVKNKKVKTKLEETPATKELFDIVRRAEKWLRENDYDIPLLKWDTKNWGEIPADFGRK
jgi:ribonuclease HI